MSSLRKLIKKIVYPHTYSGEAYIKYLRGGGAEIGKNVTIYNAKNTTIDETALPFIHIGDNVQITAGVTVLAHDYSYSVLGNVYGELPRIQRRTVIGNNVFIGMNAIILMGSSIEDNVIIGAGSVVSGHIQSNSVYAGNPAKKIYTLDQFLEKSRHSFHSSAWCYLDGLKRIKDKIEPKDLIIYQALFKNSNALKAVIDSSNFCGLEDKSRINMESYKKYDGFDQFMEGSEQ